MNMNKTHKILVGTLIALVMVVTIIGFGDNLTGYSVHGFNTDLSSFPYPFVKNNAYNNLFIVVSDSYSFMDLKTANVISDGLQGEGLFSPRIVSLSELPEGNHNLILVGNLKNFREIIYLLDPDEYNEDIIIKLIPHGKEAYLIIGGSTDLNVYRSARLVLDGNLEGLEFIK